MSWIENIQKKPREEKIRLIYIVCGIILILLLLLWALTTKIGKNMPKDTTLFQKIGQGIKDIRDNYRK